MFTSLTDWGRERTFKQACGFFLVYFVGTVVCAFLFGFTLVITLRLTPASAKGLDPLLATLVCGVLVYNILSTKGVLKSWTGVIMCLATLVLCYFFGYLSLLLVAGMTMLENEYETKGDEAKEPLVSPKKQLFLVCDISPTAVLSGIAIDMGGSFLVGMMLGIVASAYYHAFQNKDLLVTIFATNPYLIVTDLFMGSLFSILGGYVIARIVKKNIYQNVLVAAAVLVLISILVRFFSHSTPLVQFVLEQAATSLLYIIGARVYQRIR